MSSTAPAVAAPAEYRRTVWALDAGFAGFAVTTGALLVFGRSRGGAFSAFEQIGRRVAREISLAPWGDALLGLGVHLGETLLLGALVAVLLGAGRAPARWRAALIVVALWEVAAQIGALAVVRADVAAGLSVLHRIGLAALLLAALALAPRMSAGDVPSEPAT